MLVTQSCLTLCDPMDYTAHQALLSMKFSRQEYWSGFRSLLHRIFLTQGLNLGLLNCRWILYCLNQTQVLKRISVEPNTQQALNTH